MIGTGEIIVILCVVLLLFGGKKLPEFAKSLGKGIREFKKACQGTDEDPKDSSE
ncbi:MAG: Sec-independent protein translocase protein TatAy [Chlamydiae bacterium]|nr:Sec-independent protein translocase protein TatAy [Chlamydiota bacterium]